MKRSQLRHYSASNVKTHGRINTPWVKQSKAGGYQTKDQWASLSSEFMQTVPPVLNPRTVTNRLRKEWQAEARGQGFDREYQIKMPATEGATNVLCFSGTKWWIVRCYPHKKFTSICYDSRQKAWDAYSFDEIRWETIEPINPEY